jgi:hypothetical protein
MEYATVADATIPSVLTFTFGFWCTPDSFPGAPAVAREASRSRTQGEGCVAFLTGHVHAARIVTILRSFPCTVQPKKKRMYHSQPTRKGAGFRCSVRSSGKRPGEAGRARQQSQEKDEKERFKVKLRACHCKSSSCLSGAGAYERKLMETGESCCSVLKYNRVDRVKTVRTDLRDVMPGYDRTNP